MVCCCRDRQGTGQAARAGQGWGQWPLHGSTQGCRVLVDRWVLLSFSYLFSHETGAWAGREREDEREGWQVKYLFIKCFAISQLDATAWWCSWAGRRQTGSGVCGQIRSSSSPLFTSHLPGVWLLADSDEKQQNRNEVMKSPLQLWLIVGAVITASLSCTN